MTRPPRASLRHRVAAELLTIGCLLSLALPAQTTATQQTPAADDAPAGSLADGQLDLALVTTGLAAPTAVTNAGDGSGRLFVLERAGAIRVVVGGKLQAAPFMDITDRVLSGSERGLLGIAFHPDFAANRFFYVFYTRQTDGALIVSRFTADPDLAAASPTTEQFVLRIDHPAPTHNSGQLAFRSDGYLYVSIGDGGWQGDPFDSSQSRFTLLGKILRIDVDGTGAGPFGTYAVPATNPFVGISGLDEIWDYGIRNAWRFSFDDLTGDLWIGDVGQNDWEEIDREALAEAGGLNYGWNVMEGTHCYAAVSCNQTGKVQPIAEYSHDLGCAVTGGAVYRGSTQPDLFGLYVLADYCSGRVWTIPAGGTAMTERLLTTASISSFGEDESGELYATDLGGALYRVVAPAFGDITDSPFLNDINWLFYAGITTGCGGGLYCPLANVSRAQMASFLVRALDLASSATDYFTDDETSIHEADINALAQAGITTGCGGGLYCPLANVSRAQMASFLVRALDLAPSATDYFTDDETSIHEADINSLRESGITSGCGPVSYCPLGNVTREQMAAFLHRALLP
jgi:glucose/arabinose dehydrogenase